MGVFLGTPVLAPIIFCFQIRDGNYYTKMQVKISGTTVGIRFGSGFFGNRVESQTLKGRGIAFQQEANTY